MWANKKSRLLIILMVIGSLITAAVLFYPRSTAQETPEKKEPLIQRDEPVKEQVLQEDYKEKVKELLDSGNSVAKVSRETKIRKDEIRKIKKAKDKEKE